MALKDYYVVLGISRSETSSGIRARYRDLARRFHPDVAGPETTSTFQDITEAYEILGDPAARHRYHAELAVLEGRPPFPNREPVTDARREPVSLFVEPRAVRPSFEALVVEHLFGNFIGFGVPKAELPEVMTVEVTAKEAMRGVTVPIGVPSLEPCPPCGGTGRVWLFPCASCGADGAIASTRIVQVTIPPLTQPRSMIEVPLYVRGIGNLYLRLDVRVQ